MEPSKKKAIQKTDENVGTGDSIGKKLMERSA
jgi:hypothetical protein